MKRFLLLFTFIIAFSQVKSQCFEIQSILVDACDGSNEGKNEMAVFQVGSTPLNTVNMSVTWPNNSWLGLTQNAGTAADIAMVNATILGCGLLKEPVAGVLPANAKVLIVTSTAWNPLAQNFVNLTDTLYVLFQTAGNTSGHFANYNVAAGLRTLIINFSLPLGCSDAVTYDRTLLVKQNLTIGAQDGGAVEFSASGVASYVNHGCQAPFIPLSVDAGVDKTICAGSTQNFNATVSGAYTSVNWSLGSGATGTFVPTNSLSTTYSPGTGDNGTIKLYCTISKTCGTVTATAKDSVNLTILQLPIPVISATTNSICSGNTSILSYILTNAANTGTTSVLWSPGGLTTSTISVNAANVYSVQITNLCGNNSTTYTISSIPDPTVTISASSPTACAGSTVSLSATSNVGNFSWTNPVSTNSTVVVSANTTTTGVVTSTNACGSDSKTFTLTITPTPTITVDNANLSICTGQSATVTATSNITTYTWQPGGINTNTVSLNSAGIYTVDVSNVCGTASATVEVTINSVPTVSVASSTQSICASGQTTTLSLSGSTGTYSWSNGASTSTTSISSPGVYTATVTTPSCGSVTTSITIGTTPLPTISISVPTTTVCSGSSLTFTANSSDSNYLWTGGATTQTVSVNTSSIVVTTTNACGSTQATQTLNIVPLPVISVDNSNVNLCTGQSATVTASSNATTYTWQPGGTIHTNTISLNTAGVYTVNTSNLCGSASTTVDVVVTSVPTVSLASSSSSICASGQTANLTLSGSTGTYSWSNGAGTSTTSISSPGVYTATVTTPSCGSATTSITIGTTPLPTIFISVPSTTVCSGSSLTFTANSSDSNYLWTGGATTQTISVNTPSIVVTTTNACGSAQANQTLNIVPVPTVILSPNAVSLCAGQSATIQANPNTTVTYTWSTGSFTNTTIVNTPGIVTVSVSNTCGIDTETINVTSSILPVLTITPSSVLICPNETATLTVNGGSAPYLWSNSSNTGSVVTTNGGTVTVSSTNACGTSSAITVVSVFNINADVIANPTSGILPVVVSFTNNSIGASNYLWDFGNGNSATIQNVSAETYSVAGTYIVYLTASNGSCSDTYSLVINVFNEEPILVIPNVFTPNGDSINDIFRVTGFNIIDFNCTIFDRWGIQMFYWDDINKGWDGKTGGEKVPDGTYFYMINAKDIDNKEIKKQGYFQLFK